MTIDTNVLIAYLGGEEAVINKLTEWRREGKPLMLSAIVEAEVFSFSKWDDDEREIVQKFFEENFISIPFDRNVARIAAAIRRSVHLKLPDAAIAATAWSTHTPLLTRDKEGFERVSGIVVIRI